MKHKSYEMINLNLSIMWDEDTVYNTTFAEDFSYELIEYQCNALVYRMIVIKEISNKHDSY